MSLKNRNKTMLGVATAGLVLVERDDDPAVASGGDQQVA